jgi:hypothetical protein
MKTASASTTASGQAQARPPAPAGKANGRDHSVAALNGARPGNSPEDKADSTGAVPATAEELAKAAEATGKDGVEIRADDYGTRNGRMVGFKWERNAEVPFYLCNFVARITHELHTDAGTLFRIEVQLLDGSKRSFVLTTAEFANPRRWVAERLGVRASITVGQNDRVTAAIEAISRVIGFIEQKAAIATGYTVHNGSLVYVAPNRVIALPGVDTSGLILHLPDEVRRYSLAEPPTGQALVDALQAAARIPAIGKLSVTLPPWLMAFRAALPHLPAPAYVVWPHGLTGVFKSSYNAVVLNLFGRRWHYREMTGTFLDTKTSVEAAIHYPRGMLAVLDDAVADSRRGIEAVASVVSFVLRAVGNGTGRGRFKSDLSRHPTRDPRAAVIINAEGLPPGGSGSTAARALTVHMKKGDIDKERLSQAQQDGHDGVLEAAMSAFIQTMLAEDQDRFVAAFEANRRRYRDQVEAALRQAGVHGRTVDAVGDLMATAEVVTEVFGRHGVPLPFDIAEALSVLTDSGGAHSATVAGSEPVEMFRRTLRELIESGRAQIAEKKTGGRPAVNAGAWGWPRIRLDTLRTKDGVVIGCADIQGTHDIGLDVDEVFLRRDETYAVVLDALRKAGETLGLDLNSMWAALVDRGLVTVDAKAPKPTFRVRLNGVQQRFMKCKVAILSEEDSDATGEAREVEEVPDPDDPTTCY